MFPLNRVGNRKLSRRRVRSEGNSADLARSRPAPSYSALSQLTGRDKPLRPRRTTQLTQHIKHNSRRRLPAPLRSTLLVSPRSRNSNYPGAPTFTVLIGAGRLAATLGDGSLREPILAVGEGQQPAANIRFDPEPAELSMPAGPVLTSIRIARSQRGDAEFVAPVLAGAHKAKMFSTRRRVPLGEPRPPIPKAN